MSASDNINLSAKYGRYFLGNSNMEPWINLINMYSSITDYYNKQLIKAIEFFSEGPQKPTDEGNPVMTRLSYTQKPTEGNPVFPGSYNYVSPMSTNRSENCCNEVRSIQKDVESISNEVRSIQKDVESIKEDIIKIKENLGIHNDESQKADNHNKRS